MGFFCMLFTLKQRQNAGTNQLILNVSFIRKKREKNKPRCLVIEILKNRYLSLPCVFKLRTLKKKGVIKSTKGVLTLDILRCPLCWDEFGVAICRFLISILFFLTRIKRSNRVSEM